MVIKMIAHAKGGYARASLSEIDILTAFYFQVLKISPQKAADPLPGIVLSPPRDSIVHCP
jgi:transketolase N-terminal domain/subunit